MTGINFGPRHYTNARIVAEMAGFSNDGSVLEGKFPPEIALVLLVKGKEETGELFQLVSRSKLNKRIQDLGVVEQCSNLIERMKTVPGIACNQYNLPHFLVILEWYTNCDFFKERFIVKSN